MTIDAVEAFCQNASYELYEMVLAQRHFASQLCVNIVSAMIVVIQTAAHCCNDTILEWFTVAHTLITLLYGRNVTASDT